MPTLSIARLTWRLTLLLTCWLALTTETYIMAQEAYRLPPQEVVDIIDAKPDPSIRFSPDAQWMLMMERDAMPDISDISRRMLQLAGRRIDPSANSSFATSFGRGLKLKRMGQDDSVHTFDLGENVRISGVSWSHDSQHFALVTVHDSGQTLYRGNVADRKLVKLTDRLSTVMAGIDWLPDGVGIVCGLVPENRGDEPQSSGVPIGPNVQESYGNTSPTRTYQDLLQNPHDEALFEHYCTVQLTIFGSDGSQTKMGPPGILADHEISPSGDYLLTNTIHRPFSYLMTARSFPRKFELHKLNPAAAGPDHQLVADVPMAENIPIEGVQVGPRNIGFRPGEPATLVWVEALDGGDPQNTVEFRDRVMAWSQPFQDEARELVKVTHRCYGTTYFEDPQLMMTTEYDRDRRWIRSLVHHLDQPEVTPKVMTDRSIRDRYGDPGNPIARVDSTGYGVVRQDGDWIYRAGAGASPKGNLPFIDRQNIKTLEKERLWRCKEGEFESVAMVASSSADKKPVVITMRESKTAPPNYYRCDLNEPGTEVALTDFKDPTPQIRGIQKQRVTYQRSDGVPLSATLYLPANYQEGTRLPLLVWAYPREFNDAKTAGQISGSTDRFTRMRGITHLTLLTQGYAIMDAATMPVIGDPETMNDTFIEQIVDAAQAAIDKAVEMGVADRNRVAVGGHSYGAFMTANLMAHCDLFQAGVARSGAYNRTLTPFGFQSERRPYWEARGIYHKISPFMHAEKINEPLLLIHGENDNNSGTFPIQSKRMYQAIKGNGGTVRLCMLPYESHGYRARQSVLHTQAEMIEWLDKFVKNVKEN